MPASGPSSRQVVLVYKKSKLDLYVHEKQNPRYAALLEEGAEVVSGLKRAHDAHLAALAQVEEALAERSVRYRKVYRARLRNDGYRGALVITVGGDGTLLDASRKVTEGWVLGVNSDPGRSVGFLCAASAGSFGDIFDRVMEAPGADPLPPTPVPRLRLHIDGEAVGNPVLNDVLVADRNPASTARYLVEHQGNREAHKSSGIWIAAPAGTTAAACSAGGQILPLADPRFQVVVREPFYLEHQAPKLTSWRVGPDEKLRVVSNMREGRLFVDGPHHRHAFEVGSVLEVDAGAPPLHLVVTEAMRNRRESVATRRTAAGG